MCFNSVIQFTFLFQDLALIESTQLVLENIVNAVFFGSNDSDKANVEVQQALYKIFEGFLVISPCYSPGVGFVIVGHP